MALCIFSFLAKAMKNIYNHTTEHIALLHGRNIHMVLLLLYSTLVLGFVFYNLYYSPALCRLCILWQIQIVL